MHSSILRPRIVRLLLAGALLLLLAACATEPRVIALQRYAAPPPTQTRTPAVVPQRAGEYRVQPGDSLYAIAQRHGMDYRTLARINGIGPPYTIYPGQELRLHGSARAPSPASPAQVAVVAPPASAGAPPPPQAAAINPNAPWPAPPPGMPQQSVAAAASSAATPSHVAVPAPSVAPAAAVTSTASAVASAATPANAATTPVATGHAVTRDVDGIRWRWPVDGPVLEGFHADQPGRQGINIGGQMGQPVYAAASGVVVYSGSGLTGYGELVIIKHNDQFLSAYGHNSVRLVKEGQKVVAGQEIAEMGNTGAARVELHFEIRKDGKPLNPQDFLPRR